MLAPRCSRCAGVGAGSIRRLLGDVAATPGGAVDQCSASLVLGCTLVPLDAAGFDPIPHPGSVCLGSRASRFGESRGLRVGSAQRVSKPPQVGGHPVTAGADGLPAGVCRTLRGECAAGGVSKARSGWLITQGGLLVRAELRLCFDTRLAPLLTRGGCRSVPGALGC